MRKRMRGRVVLASLLAPALGLCLAAEGYGRTAPDRSDVLETATNTRHRAEQGRPFVRTFASRDYGAHPQNFDVVVGPRGRVYAANARGVLVYDGERWTLVDMPNQTAARSLARGPDGTLFVGGQDDLGRLVRDADGTLRVESLRSHIPKPHRTLSPVWRTHATDDAVYFGTEQALYRWRNGTMHVWEGPFFLTLAARGTIYVQSTNGDVQRVDGNRLVPVTGLEALPTVYTAVPLGDDLLLSTFARGMLRVDDGTVTPWRPDAADALSEARVYNAQALPTGGVALATQAGGAFVYGPNGTLHRRVDQSTGLNSDYVYGLALDHQGGLWLAQGRGLARLETHVPLSVYGRPEGLEGNVLDVARTNGTLYVGTMQGLFALRPAEAPGRAARFNPVTRMPVVHDLLVHNDALFATSAEGVLRVTDTSVQRLNVLENERAVAAALVPDPDAPSRLFVGQNPGVAVIERTDGRWRRVRTIDVPYRVSHLSMGPDGSLWTGSEAGPVYRIPRAVALGRASDTAVARFDTTAGLPSMRFNIPYRVQDRIIAGTTAGPYRFDPSTERFVPASDLRTALPDPDRYVSPIVPDTSGQIWMHVGETDAPVTGRLRPQSDGTYTWTPGALRRLVGFTTYTIHRDGAATWVGGPGRGPNALLVRLAPGAAPTARIPAPEPPSPVVQQLALVGADSTAALVSPERRADAPVLDAAFNNVRFTYAAPAYDAPENTRYRVRLRRDGSDATWSPWRATTEATFTNLGPGRYVFEVQARTVYHTVGSTAATAFVVRPPWYRTGWAYALYGLGGVALVAGLVRLRTRRLRDRQRQLEATVAARTEEVRHQKDQLAKQAEELRALDEAKSRFFANLSHEFRTPLTLILGPVRRLRQRLETTGPAALRDDAVADQLGLVERNAHRLLRMVRQILNLARHDAGTLELTARPTDLADHATRIAQAFAPLAERQHLTLTTDASPPPEDAPPVYLDAEYLEQIVSNLLANAIKFTPAGGTVTVRVDHDATTARLTVSDTGPGIPEDEHDRIFDRFTQADDTVTRDQEGAGIGLALTHTLVTLHNGTLTVDSAEGEGATFTAAFPRGRDHLTDDQVAPASGSPPDDAVPTPSPPPTIDGEAAPVAPDDRSAAPAVPEDASLDAAADASSSASSPPPLVLIVDDNPDVRTYVRSVLAPTFRIAEAGTGAEGLAAARTHLPDVILADVMMPEMDGLAMTERLRADARTAAIPIVMLTARAGTDDEVEGLSAGATDYVVKPFDPEVLEMRVRGTLAYQERLRRRLLDEIEETDTDPDAEPRSDRSAFEREMRSVAAQHLPDPDFGVSELADALAVSRSTLYRRARDADAPTPAEVLRTMRLERGAELLRDEAGTVSEVAYAVGYRSLSHFSTQFADHFGQPPTAYGADDA